MTRIAFLQSRRLAVEIGEAGGDACDVRRIVLVVENFDALDHLRQQRTDFLEALLAARAVFGDLEDGRLGMVQDLTHTATQRVVGRVGDASARRRQSAQDCTLAHDFGVAPDVGGGRHVVDQRAQIRHATNVVELLQRTEHLPQRHHVGRLVVGDELHRRLVEQAMRVTVEIVCTEDVRDTIGGTIFQQQSAEHRLLRLHRMRWELDCGNLRIVGHKAWRQMCCCCGASMSNPRTPDRRGQPAWRECDAARIAIMAHSSTPSRAF